MNTKGKIAVQMMMLKDEVAEHGSFAVVEKLAEMGFTSIEISQIPTTEENIAGFERGIKELGVKVAACSAGLVPVANGTGDFITRDYKHLVEICRRLDCSYLRIGAMPLEYLQSLEALGEFAKIAQEQALRLKEDGISLYFHNHHREFKRLEGLSVMERLHRAAPALGMELDVHWIQRGGENPLEIIKSFAGCVELLHLKDYTIDWDGDCTWQTEVVRFAEMGEGTLPMKEIIDTGLASGSRYFIIEQDNCYGRTPYESLAISRDNLVKLGFGDWL